MASPRNWWEVVLPPRAGTLRAFYPAVVQVEVVPGGDKHVAIKRVLDVFKTAGGFWEHEFDGPILADVPPEVSRFKGHRGHAYRLALGTDRPVLLKRGG